LETAEKAETRSTRVNIGRRFGWLLRTENRRTSFDNSHHSLLRPFRVTAGSAALAANPIWRASASVCFMYYSYYYLLALDI